MSTDKLIEMFDSVVLIAIPTLGLVLFGLPILFCMIQLSLFFLSHRKTKIWKFSCALAATLILLGFTWNTGTLNVLFLEIAGISYLLMFIYTWLAVPLYSFEAKKFVLKSDRLLFDKLPLIASSMVIMGLLQICTKVLTA